MKYFRIILTAITVILCAAAGWALYSVSGERLLGMDSQLGYYMAKYYRYAAAAAALFLLITVIVWTAFFSYRRKHPQPAKMKKSRKIKPAPAPVPVPQTAVQTAPASVQTAAPVSGTAAPVQTSAPRAGTAAPVQTSAPRAGTAAPANIKITPKEKTAPVKCPNCGAAVNPGQHFCTQCGFRF